MHHHPTQIRGDSNPSDVLEDKPVSVAGERLPDGNLKCGGCGGAVPDNSGAGLKPSCSFCWTAIDLPN